MNATANGRANPIGQPGTPLPSAPNSEEVIALGLIINPDHWDTQRRYLNALEIADDCHRAVTQIVPELHREGVHVSVDSALPKLEAHPAFAGLRTVDYLTGLTLDAVNQPRFVSLAAWIYHAKIVAENSRKRRIHLLAMDVAAGALNGRTSQELLANLWSTVDDMRREANDGQQFEVISARDLDGGEYEVNWLVDWVLVEGQPCIVAGGKKTLKTTLLCDLLLSLAIGCEFLGRFAVRSARRVLFCSGESGLATLQETCRRIAAAKGWDLRDVPNFILTPDVPRLDSADDFSALESLLISTEAEVFALDPAYLAMPGGDAGNLFIVGELLLRVSRLCQRLGVTLIIAHHTRKHRSAELTTFDAPELEDIAWAGFQEFARQWLLVGRRERYIPGSGEHRLWFNIGGSAGHGSLWAIDVAEGVVSDPGGRRWSVSVTKASEAIDVAQQRKALLKAEEDERQLDAARAKVCDVLAKCRPEGRTESYIRDEARVGGRRIKGVIAAMLERGEIETCDVRTGNQKSAKPGYRLKDGDDA